MFNPWPISNTYLLSLQPLLFMTSSSIGSYLQLAMDNMMHYTNSMKMW